MEAEVLSSSRNLYPLYHPDGWVCRKFFIAIPRALFSGVVMTIYHLGQSAIYSPPGSGGVIRNTYHILAKDLEEAWGWIVTLYNDERGFHLVQRSQSSEVLNGTRAPYAAEAKEISLKEFRDLDYVAQEGCKEKFGLSEQIQGKFFEKLSRIDEELLALISLFDLKTNQKILDYASYSLGELNRISLEELNSASPIELKVIFQRINLERMSPIWGCFENYMSLRLLRSNLAAISDDQFQKIDLTELTGFPDGYSFPVVTVRNGKPFDWIITSLRNGRKCFRLALKEESRETVKGIEVPYAIEAKALSLRAFSNMRYELQKMVMGKFEISEEEIPWSAWEKPVWNGFSSFSSLNEIKNFNNDLFSLISLFDLKTDLQRAKLIFCSLNEFDGMITLRDLNELATPAELKLILQRLDLHYRYRPVSAGLPLQLISLLDQISVDTLKKIDLNDFPNIPIEVFFSEERGATKERFETISPARIRYENENERLPHYLKLLLN